MKARFGFTLIEILLALMIAAIVGTGLFTLLGQSIRAFNTIDSMTTDDRVLLVAYQRLERDIIGFTIPPFGDPAVSPEEAEEKKPATEAKEKKVKTPEPMKDYVVLQHNEQLLKQLSFITNDPVHFYGITMPLLARVVYKLEPSAEGRYRLMRGQSLQLGINTVQEFFLLLDDIVHINVRIVFAKKEKAKEQKKKEKERPQYSFIDTRQLPFEEADEALLPIPITFVIEGALWDDVYKIEVPFTFRFHVPTWQSNFFVAQPKKENKLAALFKKEEKPAAQAPAKAQPTTEVTQGVANA